MMVYRVTLQHAHGKMTTSAIMELLRRLHPDMDPDIERQGATLRYRINGTEARVEHGFNEIRITPGTEQEIRANERADRLILPGLLMSARMRRKHALATSNATMAYQASLRAEPADRGSDLFRDVTETQWEEVRNGMGIDESTDVTSPFNDTSHRPEEEVLALTDAFVVQADHWSPPMAWEGRPGDDGRLWINYPRNTPQFFHRATASDAWSILWDDRRVAGGLDWSDEHQGVEVQAGA